MKPESGAILRQTEIETWYREKYGAERWTKVYQSGNLAETDVSLFACLASLSLCAQSLQDPGWSLTIGSGGPGFSQNWRDGETVAEYHKLGESNGIEPIAIVRQFSNGRPDCVEIVEDLRLFFNLYEDHAIGVFYEIGEDGQETPVIRISTDRAEIRTALLRRYLAARQVALILQIDSRVHLRLAGDQPMPQLPEKRVLASNALCLHFYADRSELSPTTSPSHQLFSRLFGKKVILPPDRAECGIWPFELAKEYVNFIIGEDERGQPVEHTCNPDVLADYFGGNQGAPHYLTPVFFSREVLRKYYENSDEYSIHDGGIGYRSVWNLDIDNHHSNYVAVFLGDLGRDLPTSEQRHWRAHNILPDERRLSETTIRRSLLGQFTEATLPEHVFKRLYRSLSRTWMTALDWPLFKELHIDDQHVLSSLRSPLTNTAREFDSQVLNLAKLMVDSLNEEQIAASLTTPPQRNDKGITKLERLLTQWQYSQVERDVALLRTIQGIRSKGAAHRKGSDYDLAQAGLDPEDFQASFQQLLERCTLMLRDLEAFARETKT